MLTVTKPQFWAFIEYGGKDSSYEEFRAECEGSNGHVNVDQPTFDALKRCDIKAILYGSELSTEHLGGDDIVAAADELLEVQEAGYTIVTWYGPNTEVLIAGYRATEIAVAE